ncbi:alpha/beta fold hydrolase [Streptococcus oriscaviae]|uniref:Alpha/beta hydrolase n=1 Tax=Streptococcus oriscaviae TaxID=2781599 RepID=A0ABX7YJ24_9STRE|nr:alpha/beta hydrolase [Streptococcus oriscaviae]QUE53462.1 alpha/beta hydrolase [Streptococcus oriscaviae]
MKRKGLLHRLLIVVTIAIVGIYCNHQIQLLLEQPLRHPLGQTVTLKDKKMNVLVEGEGEQTLVFMAGGGTISPILDFQALTSQLKAQFRIVVIEKFGYGFSEDIDEPRDIQTIVTDTRSALKQLGIQGPVILCPHSLSSLEALYWANHYPNEVAAIIGLDMAFPASYQTMDINTPLFHFLAVASHFGITRFFPNFANQPALTQSYLSKQEKATYQALLHYRPISTNTLNELEELKANADTVANIPTPTIPMTLFVSNGEGTGFSQAEWLGYAQQFSKKASNIEIIQLDCPHYIHDYLPQQIAEQIQEFLMQH